MKRFAPLMCLLPPLFPSPTLAATWPQSTTAVNECDGLPRACPKPARELKAAREPIPAFECQIAASDARIELAQGQLESLRKLSMLSEARSQELESVIAAEREAKAAAVAQIDEQKRRIRSLEKSLSRIRKFALVAGAVAVVAILIGIRN